MSSIASIVISNSTRGFDKEYHYLIPDEFVSRIKPGVRVIVPFGRTNKSYEAYVLNVVDDTNINELKAIKKVIDERPIVGENLLKLAGWMKRRYICTYNDAIKCMLPPGIGVKSLRMIKLVKNEDIKKPNHKKIIEELILCGNECEYEELKEKTQVKSFSTYIKQLEEVGAIKIYEEYSTGVKEKFIRVAYIILPKEVVIEEIESNRIKRIQQIKVLEMLLDNEYIAVSDILRFAGVSASVLDTLKKYGYIDYKEIEVQRDPFREKGIKSTKPMQPTKEQETALAQLKESLDSEEFNELLIHGVTGSGKTEVYMQSIQFCIDKGKQAIVLVPEISLTPQMTDRFKGRFGDDVAVLHSRLSIGERYDQWRLIKDDKIKVVVGARSAIFAPLKRLGIIIIDEEHETSYKSEITPKYHASEVAKERCKLEKSVLVYGSATPSVETYYRAEKGMIELVRMDKRANDSLMPKVEIVDMRNELEEGNRSIFSRRLSHDIDCNIKEKGQTMLFLNRRGHSSFVLCRSCGYVVKCLNCSISLTFHSKDQRLICHYCGYTIKSPEICPKCGSGYIKHFGTGTQRVEQEIKESFPESSVIRMDMDTTTYKNSHEEILKAFREENINIMVGTQMIAKGHDFPNVTLVGVLAADSLLNLEDYRSSERTFQLLTQVAGRAGRGEKTGRVVIQTYNTDDFSILAACEHDFMAFYRQEIRLREQLSYPPFTNIAVAILSGTNDRMVFNIAREIKNIISSQCDDNSSNIGVYGPVRAPLYKIKNKYRWRIIIKCNNMDKLIDILTHTSDDFYNRKNRYNVDLGIDINPLNML